jgi:hypothetical protein
MPLIDFPHKVQALITFRLCAARTKKSLFSHRTLVFDIIYQSADYFMRATCVKFNIAFAKTRAHL